MNIIVLLRSSRIRCLVEQEGRLQISEGRARIGIARTMGFVIVWFYNVYEIKYLSGGLSIARRLGSIGAVVAATALEVEGVRIELTALLVLGGTRQPIITECENMDFIFRLKRTCRSRRRWTQRFPPSTAP